MNNLLNLGVIEVMDLSGMGKMSRIRASRVRNDHGGRPWRFPSPSEIDYIGSLKSDYNIAPFVVGYYWSNVAIYETSSICYHLIDGSGQDIKNSSAWAYLILVRNL